MNAKIGDVRILKKKTHSLFNLRIEIKIQNQST